MQFWFTADTHFGHGNIIKYCNRPFLSREEREALRGNARARLRLSAETVKRHDDALLEAINARVAPDDTLWIAGDFCWGGFAEARHYRDRIRCENVFLVWGNHDRGEIAPVFTDTMEQGMIRVEGQEIWLNHYPMRSWNKAFHGSWHIYGHVHGRLVREDERNLGALVRDVGVDACDYKPISFAELREYMAPRVDAFNRNKAAFVAGQDDGSMPM
jgi:calcineurin-like phosphoesterase family protein